MYPLTRVDRHQLVDKQQIANWYAPMKIASLQAVRVRIPQKAPIAPYQNRYKAGTYKECILVRLETDNGIVGWGETPEDWINKSFEGTPGRADAQGSHWPRSV